MGLKMRAMRVGVEELRDWGEWVQGCKKTFKTGMNGFRDVKILYKNEVGSTVAINASTSFG